MNKPKKSDASRMKTRILFTTACENVPYEYISTNIADSGHNLRFERRISFGLRFLQANIPEIAILEYPSWKEYLRVLSLGWDVTGYSFYANEIPVIRRMVSAARRLGVAELWGGNYGVITPKAATLFDRVFYGYSEGQIAKSLGISPHKLVHPPLITHFCFGRGLGLLPVGILFTQRGCNRNCTFCQTPVFCSQILNPISIESVKGVVNVYRRLRVVTRRVLASDRLLSERLYVCMVLMGAESKTRNLNNMRILIEVQKVCYVANVSEDGVSSETI